MTTLPPESFITAALAELIEDVTNLLSAAQQTTPPDPHELKFWRCQMNALNRAAYHWSTGVRPCRSGGAWLLPSASRPGALVHRLAKHGGIVVCSCEAGARGLLCWHHMLISVVERAAELATLADPPNEPNPLGDDEGEPLPERRPLGCRLAEARSNYVYC